MGDVIKFPGGPCRHIWDEPIQPLCNSAGERYEQCVKCGEMKTAPWVPPTPGTTPGLPEFERLTDKGREALKEEG